MVERRPIRLLQPEMRVLLRGEPSAASYFAYDYVQPCVTILPIGNDLMRPGSLRRTLNVWCRRAREGQRPIVRRNLHIVIFLPASHGVPNRLRTPLRQPNWGTTAPHCLL